MESDEVEVLHSNLVRQLYFSRFCENSVSAKVLYCVFPIFSSPVWTLNSNYPSSSNFLPSTPL